VAATLATWLLDEVSGTRVNAEGTTARDLSGIDGSDPTSSTDRMEGTRSMSLASSQARHTTDTFSAVVSPISVGCWTKPSTQGFPFVMHDFQSSTAGTSQLLRGTSDFRFRVVDSVNAQKDAASAASYPTGSWFHVVGTMQSTVAVTLYVNGVQVATTPMTTASARATPLYLGDNVGFVGLVDECFFANTLLSAASVCRICSCGIRGEQCTCAGTAFATTGRNATACGSCTLPANCAAAAPS
jgi:hypothetical protein